MDNYFLDELTIENETKIVLLVMDGLGGLRIPGKSGTELQEAHTPNLDQLAKESVCGLLDPIWPGVTPGSGPAHFSLFGYNAFEYNLGRGVLDAAGIGFKFTDRDVAARINFATIDENGNLVDRRAGRLPTEENQRLCEKIKKNISVPSGIEVFIEPTKEYRSVIILRGEGLSGQVADTDPQKIGVPPLDPIALSPEAERTAAIFKDLLKQIRDILADEPRGNMLLLRGVDKYKHIPSMEKRFKLRSYAIANYPMYRGVAQMVGMVLHPITPDIPSQFKAFQDTFQQYDYFFIHIKYTDSRGEDGDFDAKVKVIEEVDQQIPRLVEMNPEVLMVTADHSTPALLKSHSWHPVPVLLHASTARVDEVDKFDEISCIRGGLGRQPTLNLMGLALAHALRLKKLGA